jgi:CheY-like chemotaxis protein
MEIGMGDRNCGVDGGHGEEGHQAAEPSGPQSSALLGCLNKPACIFDVGGHIVWANAKFRELPENVRSTLIRSGQEASAGSESETASCLRLRLPELGSLEWTLAPVQDGGTGIRRIAAVVWPDSPGQRLQEQFNAIDLAGRELVSLDVEQWSRLDVQGRLALLEQRILRSTRDLLHFDNFEIRVVNRRTNRLELLLASGLPPDAAGVELHASTEGSGICGYVAATGKSYLCPDADRDPRYLPGLANARSSLTIPLHLHDRVVGVANFESTHPAAFGEEDRQFAEIFGRYVALALHILELVVTERQTTTGQLCGNVLTELTGPINDILTEVENLVEDYIGHDDLRRRLRLISENGVKIRETIKDLTSAKSGVLGGRAARAAAGDPLLKGKRILVVDDEEVIRETVRDVLVGHGCSVMAASEGATAVELVGKNQFDLVVTDITMPLKSGYEVFAAAKNVDPSLPVIFTTGFGYDPNHSIVRARREGLAAVLFKPFKVDQLLQEIRTALQARPIDPPPCPALPQAAE